MRVPLYDRNAKRRTVSLTLNADLVARSRALGINISQVAEAALVQAFETAEKAAVRAELKEDARFVVDYVAQHGHPFPDHRALFVPDDEEDHAA